ncbi:hypothetical protein H4R20_001588 [Coemansia guatemalensis]|uniref:Uncharacterized protein n=1 Tax=Coemansia guatemalensis TaxID=2761395 RepID=A0A9W8LVV2_9FUNG|nr:hypothetical protein H4R20_001588 [Coemansia guatemalensis]
MSYIPRPEASGGAKATIGRADELRLMHSMRSSNSPALQGSPGQAIGGKEQMGVVRMPVSTRSSVVRVLSDDSPLPGLPPIPAVDAGRLSAVSTTVPNKEHRRTASAGNEKRQGALESIEEMQPQPGEASTIELATDNRPRRSKSRLGLGSLRVVWPQGKAQQQQQQARTLGGPRGRWTADETNELGQASLRSWKGGRPMDMRIAAADLGRSTREIGEMLEHMLEGFARFGGGVACWEAQSHRFIMRWAAVEFPNNPILNQPDVAESRLNTCFSALSCRPRSARASLYVSNSPNTSSVVTDFREGMRERTDAPLSPGPSAFVPAGIKAVPDKTAAGAVSVSEEKQALDLRSDGVPVHDRPKSVPHAAPRQKSPAQMVGERVSSTQGDEAADGTTRPVFTGSIRSRQGINTMSRESRNRRARRGSLLADRTAAAKPSTGAVSNAADSPATAATAFTFSPTLVAAADKVSLSGVGSADAAHVGSSNSSSGSIPSTSSRRRAHTVAHPPQTLADRASRDSGTVEAAAALIPMVAALDNIELSSEQSPEQSPEQSRQAIEVRVSDSQLDAEYADLTADTRKKVRRFVDRFVRDYPSDFQQRVDAQRTGKDGLCITVDHYDFEYNDAFMKAIETIYRYVGGSMLYTCNMFFHVQLLHAVRLDGIRFADDRWLRVDEFATRVFNKRIEDARFVVLQEHHEGSGLPPVSTPLEGDGSLSPGARSRFESLTGSEGNEHRSPFERAFYMDKLAHRYVQFFLENNSDEIMLRARTNGPRPMPVALCVDETAMLQFDREIRNLVVGFVWEDIPLATLESKELTLLRALELMNCEIADRCGFYQSNLPQIMDATNSDGFEEPDVSDNVLADLPAVRIARAVGRAFAREHFPAARAAFLQAMVHDHPFRPLARDEMKEWIERGGSPFGQDVDYMLNAGLYRYLKRLRLRPSKRQWLQASAEATLSMLRRTFNATTQKKYIAHIDIPAYESMFSTIVQDARASASATTAPAVREVTCAAGPGLSPFESTPEWVSQLVDSRLSRSTGQAAAATATNTNTAATMSGINSLESVEESSHSMSGELQSTHQPREQQQQAVNGMMGTPTRELPLSGAEMKDDGITYSAASPEYGDTRVALSTSPVLPTSPPYLGSLPLSVPQFTVPMPTVSHHIPHAAEMPVPQMFTPFHPMPLPLEMQRQLTTAATGYPPPTSSAKDADMSMVLHKFEEMQEMLRRLQAQRESS